MLQIVSADWQDIYTITVRESNKPVRFSVASDYPVYVLKWRKDDGSFYMEVVAVNNIDEVKSYIRSTDGVTLEGMKRLDEIVFGKYAPELYNLPCCPLCEKAIDGCLCTAEDLDTFLGDSLDV